MDAPLFKTFRERKTSTTGPQLMEYEEYHPQENFKLTYLFDIQYYSGKFYFFQHV